MVEPQPIKKGMGKSLVIALCVLVIILATSLIYTYTSLQGQISSLNTDKTNLQTQVTSLTTDKNNLNSQVTSLQSQLNNLISIINLTNSTVWVDNQTVTHYTGLYTAFGFLSSYAGYISVDVESSTSSHTYVRVIYSSHGVNYDQQISVGAGGIAYFPILPSDTLEVRIGNTEVYGPSGGYRATVTITYYY